jgi:hypothetical protein
MQNVKKRHITNLLQAYPKGLVLTPSFLEKEGFSLSLQQWYRKSHWLKSLGSKGAMLIEGSKPYLTGALMAMQLQQNSDVHIGGATALELQGNAQYLRMMFSGKASIFVEKKRTLPQWFINTEWDTQFEVFSFSLFRDNSLGLTDFTEGELTAKISTRERAIMECLYLCPDKFSLVEVMEIMDGLTTLRPDMLQSLLENCSSIKVKRLFLFFAEKSNWSWFNFINTNKIDLGVGTRAIRKNGFFNEKYQLVLPKEVL